MIRASVDASQQMQDTVQQLIAANEAFKGVIMAEWDDLKKTVADLGVKVDAAVAVMSSAPSKTDIKQVTSDIAAANAKLDKATTK